MKTAFKVVLGTIAVCLFTAGQSQANIVVYEKVELFQAETFFTETFEIFDEGSYTATLTDFEFPAAMLGTGMSVTTATEMLGSLSAPGSFTFDAIAGDYYVSFFGIADGSTLSQLGQYGIEISQVPLPAAAWLFVSGMLGLVGIARRKVPQSLK